MENIVEMKNVSKIYKIGEKEFKALDNIDLNIKKGEFVVVLGPSGAGKSTLLNLIGGMDTPSNGAIKVDGEDISKYNENKLSEYRAENIGFIFQFYNILPTLTVLENVELVKDVVKNGTDSEEAIKSVGLGEHMNKFPSQLSGGEQQRVSIARAIAKNPKLLLCDEPTGALDSKTGVEVLKLLKKQCDGNNVERQTIINTTVKEKEDVTLETIFIESNDISKMYVKKGEEFDKNKTGVWLDSYLAKKINLNVGDEITWHIFGDEKWYTSKVVGINRDSQSQQLNATRKYFESLDLTYRANSVYTNEDLSSIKEIDGVDTIQSIQS